MLLVAGFSECTDTSERIGAEYDNYTVKQIKDNTTAVSYEVLMRFMENHVGKIVCFRGEIDQVFGEISFTIYAKKMGEARTWDRINVIDYKTI